MSDECLEVDAELVAALRAGDPNAAAELYRQHVPHLVVVAQRHLSQRLRRRMDAEDVVQSAFRSFCLRMRNGQFQFDEQDDIWRLLVTITLNKLRQKAEYHSAGKRSIEREQSLTPLTADQTWKNLDAVARDPAPDEQLVLLEDIDHLTEGLDEHQKRMVELRLLGYQLDEIAQATERSERTVRRVMDKVKERLEQMVASAS
jgi:RNA polymerase sigma-70 factor (ECF subfamily)